MKRVLGHMLMHGCIVDGESNGKIRLALERNKGKRLRTLLILCFNKMNNGKSF